MSGPKTDLCSHDLVQFKNCVDRSLSQSLFSTLRAWTRSTEPER